MGPSSLCIPMPANINTLIPTGFRHSTSHSIPNLMIIIFTLHSLTSSYKDQPARYVVGLVSPAMWVTRLVVWAI